MRPPGVYYISLCSTCMTYGTQFCVIVNQVLPTHPLPEEADFPRGGKYPQDVPLPIYLVYLEPKGISW